MISPRGSGALPDPAPKGPEGGAYPSPDDPGAASFLVLKKRALADLAGGLAHDLNNILMAVIVNTELALLTGGEDHPAAQSLELVLRAASRGRELLQDIALYAKPRTGERRAVDLAEVVGEALKTVRASLPAGISLRADLGEKVASCAADPVLIRRAVVNLCDHGIRSMRGKGGTMSVGLSKATLGPEESALPPGAYLELTIADTGAGLTPEAAERVFDPYFKPDASSEGAGWRMAVAQGIVQGHGGAISLSTAPGRGSEFHVYLPRTAS